MRTANKATKTFSLDRGILLEIKRTKGASSESERVNTLLGIALELEKAAAFEREAASFFASAPKDREERRAFQRASMAALARH